MDFGDEEARPQKGIEKIREHDYEPAPAMIKAGS
jgi:hypothetical protein